MQLPREGDKRTGHELTRRRAAAARSAALRRTARSHLPEAAAHALREPVLTAVGLATWLRISPQAALGLLRQLVKAGVLQGGHWMRSLARLRGGIVCASAVQWPASSLAGYEPADVLVLTMGIYDVEDANRRGEWCLRSGLPLNAGYGAHSVERPDPAEFGRSSCG